MTGSAEDAQIRRTLREKYEELLRLRRERAEGMPADRERVRALSRRYPGALRELDHTVLSELARRLEELDAEAALPEWARITHDFHCWTGALLRVRRAAGRGRDGSSALSQLAVEGPIVGLGPEALSAILKPPGGRLSTWVLAKLAERHGVSEAVAAHLVFGYRPRRP